MISPWPIANGWAAQERGEDEEGHDLLSMWRHDSGSVRAPRSGRQLLSPHRKAFFIAPSRNFIVCRRRFLA